MRAAGMQNGPAEPLCQLTRLWRWGIMEPKKVPNKEADMARATIEVPWQGVVFPQKCASCGNPMVTKTVPIKRATQKQQRRQSTGYLLGGAIGMAIAGSGGGPDKYVQFQVPFCQDCVARDRKFKAAGWITLVLGFLSIIVLPVIAAGLESEGSGTLIGLGVLLGAVLLIASIVIFVMASNRTPVTIKAVKDKFQGAVLAFRDPAYRDEFGQVNLARLVPYELQAGLPLSATPDQALAIVSQAIDAGQPGSEDTVRGHYYRAQIYMRGESYSQAVDDLNKVISGGASTMPDAYFLRGQALLNLARYQEAATDLNTFIQATSDRQKAGEAKKLLKKVSSYQ
jgi:hypothetical protein